MFKSYFYIRSFCIYYFLKWKIDHTALVHVTEKIEVIKINIKNFCVQIFCFSMQSLQILNQLSISSSINTHFFDFITGSHGFPADRSLKSFLNGFHFGHFGDHNSKLGLFKYQFKQIEFHGLSINNTKLIAHCRQK